MIYKLIYSKTFLEDVVKLKKSEPTAYKKAMNLLKEIETHPKTGTGKPEALKNNRTGQWSRRISQKHRLIYKIKEEIIEIYLISAYGHYK